MKTLNLHIYQNAFEQSYGDDADKIIEKAQIIYEDLCSKYINENKVKKKHLYQNILPCISLYQAMQQNGIDKKEAVAFLDHLWSEQAKKQAQQMKVVLSYFHLYKLYPAMFKMVAQKQFGKTAGFEAKFYDCGKQHCKFDMTKCLFMDICKKYNCSELVPCFCHVDDINNADLHPCLCWNRSQYMGNGAAYCDFDIFVTKE